MIYIKNNHINPVILPLSDILGLCSEFTLKLINETNNKVVYIANSNLSSFIASYDLLELELSSTAILKEYYFDEPIKLMNGQYTAYIYHSLDLPTTKEEVISLVENNSKLCHITKFVVGSDGLEVNGIGTDGIKTKYK